MPIEPMISFSHLSVRQKLIWLILLASALAAIVGEKGQDWHLLTSGAFISMILPLAVFFALYGVDGLPA